VGEVLHKIWADPVWSKVIATGIVAALGSSLAWAWWTPLLAWASACITFLGNATPVPNWLLGIAIVLSLVALGGAVLLGVVAFQDEGASSPDQYRRDHFLGMVWRWRYGRGNDIYSLVPFCPHCDFQIIPRHPSAYEAVDRLAFECEHCSQFSTTLDGTWNDIEGRVERLVHLKLRNGEWAKVAS
jgi:hypothetical protein